jgi:adenosylhomocysteine nucleosidase
VTTSSERVRRGYWTSYRNDKRFRQGSAVDPRVVAVVGLQFEARIIAGPAVRAVVLGSETTPLVAMLLPTDRGVISFGICGGLAPGLAPGACVIASSISDGARAWVTDRAWTRSLAQLIPNAVVGPILGVDAPVLDVAAKTSLHKRHGAVAVDMESHVAALAASAHGLPLVAVRAVADDATCALLTVALAGRRADGSVNVAGVLAALREKPGELAPLIRLAVRANSARATLVRLRPILGSDFGTP